MGDVKERLRELSFRLRRDGLVSSAEKVWLGLERIEALEAALGEIAHHGISQPVGDPYSEETWWRMVATDCMRIAGAALHGGRKEGA